MSDKNSNKLSTTFADSPLSSHGPKWASLWDESYTPWDRGGPSLALHDLLETRNDLFPAQGSHSSGQGTRSRALVPGCGRGHDVLLLASFGYDVIGLDVAPKAMEEAASNQNSVEAALEQGEKAGEGDDNGPLQYLKLKNGVDARGDIKWVAGDFFADDWLKECGLGTDTKFDLIFDYTFLCALPPTSRPQWAARMASLVKPQTGRLVCLEFPSGKPMSELGPPWGLSTEMYETLLSRPGDETAPGATDPRDVRESDGLTRVDRVKPSRTHTSGTREDGTVRDWIHVWGRMGRRS